MVAAYKIPRKRLEKTRRFHIFSREYKYILPQHARVMLSTRQDAARVHLYELFNVLDIPLERLTEVFEHTDIFTGRFRGNGRQKLADILSKEIEYHDGYLGDPFGELYFKKGRVYNPTKN